MEALGAVAVVAVVAMEAEEVHAEAEGHVEAADVEEDVEEGVTDR